MKQSERKKIIHSKEDVLSEKEIYKIINKSAHNLKTEFIIKSLLFGGLRASELAHLRKSWWSKEEGTIDIPTQQQCSCRDCRVRKFSMEIYKTWKKEHPNMIFSIERLKKSIREERFYKEEFSKIVSGIWEPKTYAGIRKIPIIYNEFKDVLERFFSKYEQVGITRYRVWQIVVNVAKDCGVKNEQRDVYPHCIRATCASLWGQKKVSAATMCKRFGWDNISSANPYITTDEERAKQEEEELAGDGLW